MANGLGAREQLWTYDIRAYDREIATEKRHRVGIAMKISLGYFGFYERAVPLKL